MKVFILLVVVAAAFVGSALSCTPCAHMKWATCDGPQCTCTLAVNDGQNGRRTQNVDCTKLIPKCFLMQAEMYRARNNMTTRSIDGKPHETAFLDNDGIYDPICESDGKFKAKQCNYTDECWCVNSAGVRRTDKGDASLKCDELVETYWVSIRLTHEKMSGNNPLDADKLKSDLSDAIKTRYGFDSSLVESVQYDPDARLIVMDVKKEMGDRTTNLAHMAYYLEKDVNVLPLFNAQDKFEPVVGGTKLKLEKAVVYYVDEKPPTFTMKHLSGGIVAVIVVVVAAVVIGLLTLFFVNKKRQSYKKAQQNDS